MSILSIAQDTKLVKKTWVSTVPVILLERLRQEDGELKVNGIVKQHFKIVMFLYIGSKRLENRINRMVLFIDSVNS